MVSVQLQLVFFVQNQSGIQWNAGSTVVYVFLLHVLNKNENFINAGYCGYFVKIAKINSQQEKPICTDRKN